MYKNPQIIKSFLATAAIAGNLAVKFGADDSTVAVATASTDLVIGFTDELGITTDDITKGKRVDVVMAGIGEITAGGDVTRGQRLTATTGGKSIAAAPAAGVNAQVSAIALASAADGDIIPALIQLSVMNGAT